MEIGSSSRYSLRTLADHCLSDCFDTLGLVPASIAFFSAVQCGTGSVPVGVIRFHGTPNSLVTMMAAELGQAKQKKRLTNENKENVSLALPYICRASCLIGLPDLEIACSHVVLPLMLPMFCSGSILGGLREPGLGLKYPLTRTQNLTSVQVMFEPEPSNRTSSNGSNTGSTSSN